MVISIRQVVNTLLKVTVCRRLTYPFHLQVISLCERLAGQDAKVTTVPVGVLKTTRLLTRLFQWTTDVADRLAFSEVSLYVAVCKAK
jgi:hypothetical protein